MATLSLQTPLQIDTTKIQLPIPGYIFVAKSEAFVEDKSFIRIRINLEGKNIIPKKADKAYRDLFKRFVKPVFRNIAIFHFYSPDGYIRELSFYLRNQDQLKHVIEVLDKVSSISKKTFLLTVETIEKKQNKP